MPCSPARARSPGCCSGDLLIWTRRSSTCCRSFADEVLNWSVPVSWPSSSCVWFVSAPVAAVHTTGPPELRGFSRNLQRDWHAVSAGLTQRWNSGCVEGHVNKLKSVSSDDFDRHDWNACSTMVRRRGGCLAYGCELGRRSARRDPVGPVPASQCRAPRSCICDSASQVLPPTEDGRCLRAKLGSLSGLVRRGTCRALA